MMDTSFTFKVEINLSDWLRFDDLRINQEAHND